MQSFLLALLPLIANAGTSPVSKVLSMISDLEAKITAEGDASQKEYAEFTEWCEDRSRNLGFEIKTGQSQVESLKAKVAEEAASIDSLKEQVEELAASIAADEADLKAATKVRKVENEDMLAEEQDLMETLDTLKRAITILEREMQGGKSMLQVNNAGDVVQAFATLVQSSVITSSDASKLTALVQQSAKLEDAAPDAPAGAVYESHSSGLVDTLQDLADKAESQLADLRQKETDSLHNFEMLKQSLTDALKVSKKDLDEAKKGIASSTEQKSTAEGDLTVTSKELAEDKVAKEGLHHDCIARSEAYQAETKSRAEELVVLAKAKKIIQEAMDTSFEQVSFVQMQMLTGATSVTEATVRYVRDLARRQNAGELMQLASQISSAMSARDSFGKVKNLISEMISKLEDEAGADATEKAFCDKELAESRAKKGEKTDEINVASGRIDQIAAKSAELKEQVAILENELSALTKSQAEMDKLRQEESAAYKENKAVLEKGLAGLRKALQVLRAYYAKEGKAHDSADGASSGIIALLEVIEADFTKDLARVESEEELASSEYEDQTKENEIEKTTKSQGVKYKTQEMKMLAKSSSELTSDRSGVQAELDAVNEYLAKIEERCIAKAETYASRKEKRAAEIAGLKEALSILESETALTQRQVRHRLLRGSHHLSM